jgi:hypothetical protein
LVAKISKLSFGKTSKSLTHFKYRYFNKILEADITTYGMPGELVTLKKFNHDDSEAEADDASEHISDGLDDTVLASENLNNDTL